MNIRKTFRLDPHLNKSIQSISTNYTHGIHEIARRYEVVMSEINLPLTLSQIEQVRAVYEGLTLGKNINIEYKLFVYHMNDTSEELILACESLSKIEFIKLMSRVGK